MKNPCNILLLMADQFRRDALGCLGNHHRSPALDALAMEGVVFRRAVTNSPDCIPARFTLATGLYPHQSGIWINADVTLAPTAWTWMRALREAGYRTSLFGKTHFHENAQDRGDLRAGLFLMRAYGFEVVDEIAGPRGSMYALSNMTERWRDAGLWELYRRDFQERYATKPCLVRPSPLGREHYYDTYVGQRAAEFLSGCGAEPWFCWVSFGGPHEPWDAPAPYDALYHPGDMPKPVARMDNHERAEGLLGRAFRSTTLSPPLTAWEVATMRANYAGNVRLIDDQIRSILDVIAARGFYDNTLVVFTSDHGEMNGDHGLIYKMNFLAAAVDIPLIVRPPKGNTKTQYPAVSDALVELMDIGPTALDYAGLPFPPWSPARSLRPLIEGCTSTHRPYVVAEFAGHTMIGDEHWKAEFTPEKHAALLFDRDADPDEQRNRISDSGVCGIVGTLENWRRDHLARSSETKRISL
jgi:arylsulfatase